MALDPLVTGSLISGASSLAGGFLDSSSQSSINDKILANAAKDRQLQRKFAKQGIQWRVNDAKKAGIHPLFSLGASIPTYSPAPISLGGSSMGAALSNAGQDVGRAVAATQTRPERDLAIQRSVLENRLLELQVATLTKESQTPPAFPLSSASDTSGMPGQPSFEGRHPGYLIEPRPIQASAPNDPSRVAGTVPSWGLTLNMDGSLSIVPGTDVKEVLEDSFPLELRWMYEHIAKPLWSRERMRLIASKLHLTNPTKPGHHWQWFTASQKFYQTPDHNKPNRGKRKASWEDLQPRTMRIPGKSGIHY